MINRVIETLLDLFPKYQEHGDEIEFWEKHWQKRCLYMEEKGIPWQLDGFWPKTLYKRKIKLFNNLVGDVNGKKLLEAGAGCGIVSLAQIKRGAYVELLELSDSAIKYMHMVSNYLNINKMDMNIGKGDLFNIPFDKETFDISWNSGVIEHYNHAQKALAEMKRVTKKKGDIIVAVPNLLSPELLYNQLKNGRGSEHYFSRASLKQFLENNGLCDVTVETIPQVLPSILNESYLKTLKKYESRFTAIGMIHFAKGTNYL